MELFLCFTICWISTSRDKNFKNSFGCFEFSAAFFLGLWAGFYLPPNSSSELLKSFAEIVFCFWLLFPIWLFLGLLLPDDFLGFFCFDKFCCTCEFKLSVEFFSMLSTLMCLCFESEIIGGFVTPLRLRNEDSEDKSKSFLSSLLALEMKELLSLSFLIDLLTTFSSFSSETELRLSFWFYLLY